MKAHVGTDRRGIVHTLTTTAANVHDSTQIAKLLHGQEREVLGDQAYWSEWHRQGARAVGIRYRINRSWTSRALLAKGCLDDSAIPPATRRAPTERAGHPPQLFTVRRSWLAAVDTPRPRVGEARPPRPRVGEQPLAARRRASTAAATSV